MFLKLNMSLIPNNPTDGAESLIWNTLIPSRPELPDDIDDSNDNENEEDEMMMMMMKRKIMIMTKMMIYHQCQLKVRKPTIRVDFKPFNFLVQQHETTKPSESNTIKYILFGFV
jgi:hypothetical protein